MTDPSLLPDCLALRIGLAARALPDTSSAELVRVLVAVLGEPLTEAKLNGLKVKDLRTGANGALSEIDNMAAWRQALQFLHGEADGAAPAAVPTPVEIDGPLPGSIRIACASNTGERLDGHFGSCARFLIYQVSAAEARLIAVRPAPATTKLNPDHSAERVTLIKDCDLLGVLSIGGPAAARVVNSPSSVRRPRKFRCCWASCNGSWRASIRRRGWRRNWAAPWNRRPMWKPMWKLNHDYSAPTDRYCPAG
jgi:nitrogen fixation protein NifX